MSLDHLDRYIWEAEAHANELLDLVPSDERAALAHHFHEMWADLLPHLQAPPKQVFVFLGEDPAAQQRRAAKLRHEDWLLLWAQARFQALQAATALRQAATVANVKGMKYRRAVRHVAQAVSQSPAPPGPRDVALLRLPD